MAVQFQSLRSSSSGNCLMLRSDNTTVLLDCGIKTQRNCQELLDHYVGRRTRLDGVVISHAHGDHVCYSSLKVLDRCGIPIRCHEQVTDQIHAKHVQGWDLAADIGRFSSSPFEVGEFHFRPIEIPHAPGFPTFGFVITCGKGKQRTKLVVCTDLHGGDAILDHCIDADFLFVEANHDLELLRRFPNYASAFHLGNAKAASLLCHARQRRAIAPQAVMLGHLSAQRNTDALALETVKETFATAGMPLDFHLDIAPRYEPSKVIRID